MTTLTARTVAVEFDGDRIVDVRPGEPTADYAVLAPGFIDLQVNGIGDVNVADAVGGDWEYLDARLVEQGVTAWCPTLVTAPLDAFAAPLERMAAAARRDGPVPAILGAHLEGPFLGGAPGAHPIDLLQPINQPWLDALPGIVRLITLAPELDGAIDAIATLVARGITVSVGHSTATYEQTLAAADAGATMVTHCFNGMGALHHREPGLLGAALSDDRLHVGVIADLVHVHPAAIRIAFAAKRDRVVLVTDAVAWRGPVVDAPRLNDGTLAGSCLTMDGAIRNVGGLSDQVLRATSTTPADLIGEPDRGRLEVGARADLVALDEDLRVVATWIGGEKVYQR